MAKRIWLMGMIVFDFLDLLTTDFIIRAGLAEEMNPIVAYFMNKLGLGAGIWLIGSLLKIITIIFILLVLRYFELRKPPIIFQWFRGLAYLMLFLRIFVVFNHLSIISG